VPTHDTTSRQTGLGNGENRRLIIISTMQCRHEVSAATFPRRRRQREHILGSIAIKVASSFLRHANIRS
jgi:hypothetical protein